MVFCKKRDLCAAAFFATALCAPAVHADRGISVGLQSTMSSSGPSIRYPISEHVSLQGVLGALGTTTSATGRGLLYFQDTEVLDYYYFGQVGYWQYSGRGFDDSGLGLGVGVGLDYELQEAIDNFLPITFSVEAGIGYVAFDDYNGFDLFNIGIAFHYNLEQ